MGTWGNGNFDNDGAMDFLIRLISQDTLQSVEKAFDAILAVEGYIDVDYGEEVISAAEVVAVLKGQPSDTAPESLLIWHQSHHLTVDDALTVKAIEAVKKAADSDLSEFRGLREEGYGLPGWYENIVNLLERLRL